MPSRDDCCKKRRLDMMLSISLSSRFLGVPFRATLPALMISASLMLSGCQSSEEKAERYYQSGLDLLAKGDEERALLEFRNVFKYDGFHKEARKVYADTVLKRGDLIEAYGQYLRLIEQYPDTLDVRQTLAEIAFDRGDWDEAVRHGNAAITLAPTDPRSLAIKVALDYRAALIARDDTAKAKAVEDAKTLLVGAPDNRIARRVLIDSLLNSARPADALPEIDRFLALDPMARDLQMFKLRLLVMDTDIDAAGVQLKEMYALFPEDQEIRNSLIRWYLVRKDIDGAEGFLRQLAGDPTSDPENHVAVVQFLQTARGPEAAQAELLKLAAANAGSSNADIYRAMSATIDFQAGRQTEAIIILEEVLKAATPSDQTNRIKVMLARMLNATGNTVGARARVEEVLAADASNVDALKLRASWLIAEDKPGQAIIDLRTALSQNPRDADTLTLMAEAHERDGSPELAGERLALAVEVSNKAVPESLRYAQFLLRSNRVNAAEAVLTDARKANPESVPILVRLGDVLLQERDYTRLQGVIETLRQIKSPEAQQATERLQTSSMMGQQRVDDSLNFLQGLVDEGTANTQTLALMVQVQLRAGKIDEARKLLDEALAKTPDDMALRTLSASIYALNGQTAPAEKIYRALIAEDPTAENPVWLLYSLLMANGREAEANTVIDQALAVQPKSLTLKWIKAGQMERAGKIDEAIALYEEIYAENSANTLAANNLASLISTHRTDPESLDRAYAIARRLRGIEVSAFQDTYGWIEYRRGNFADAVASLEPAAKGLPKDPMVQFHLGMAYAALNRDADAARMFQLALDLAGNSPLPQFDTAREMLAKVQPAAPDTPAPDLGSVLDRDPLPGTPKP